MSAQEPTRVYVYQPGAITEGGEIFAVGGPGTERFANKRYTRGEAQIIADKLNAECNESRIRIGDPVHRVDIEVFKK